MAHYNNQCESVTHNKSDIGWLYGGTPPYVFTHNKQLCAMISTSLVSEIQSNTSKNKFAYTSGLVILPSVTGSTIPILPLVKTYSKNRGHSFVREQKCQKPRSDSISINSIIIKGSLYQGQIFDANDYQII